MEHQSAYKSKHPLYNRYRTMISRCENPRHDTYKYYGGRGIRVCARWRSSFHAFLEDMGMPAPGMSLERKNNHGPYSPGNCCWATRKQQMNNKRTTRQYTLRGETHTLPEWCVLFNMSWDIVWSRIAVYHWDIERALTIPIRKQKRLSASEIEEIRTLYAKGDVQQKELARQYRVSSATICAIVNRKWRKTT